jgi:serine phosphatase RsbU (regulator of sigma subunit)
MWLSSDMKFLNTIPARTSILTAMAVFVSTLIVYILNFSILQKSASLQALDDLQIHAINAASDTRKTIKNFIDLSRITFSGASSQNPAAAASQLLKVSEEIIGIQMIDLSRTTPVTNLFRFTENFTDPRFEDKSPQKLEGKVSRTVTQWMKDQRSQILKQDISLKNITTESQVPMMAIAIRQGSRPPSNSNFLVVIAWQTSIIQSLTRDNGAIARILDSSLSVFSSPILKEVTSAKSFNKSPIAIGAKRGNERNSVLDHYKGENDENLLGAYARLPDLDEMTIIVEKNKNKLLLTLDRLLISFLLTSSLFVLGAVGLGYFFGQNYRKKFKNLISFVTRIGNGDYDTRLFEKQEEEFNALSSSLNQLSRSVQNQIKHATSKAKKDKEIDFAKILNGTLIPQTEIHSGILSVGGFFHPSEQSSGNIWGHFQTDKHVHYVFIADAMGNGPSSVISASILFSNLRSNAISVGNASMASPRYFLGKANRLFFDLYGGKVGISCFLLCINLDKMTLTYANAGHHLPILLPKKNTRHRSQTKEIKDEEFGEFSPSILEEKGTPIGIQDDTFYSESHISLAPGDRIYLYSDGFLRCESQNGLKTTKKELFQRIVQSGNLSPDESKDDIIRKSFKNFGTKPLIDDITLVVLALDETSKRTLSPAKELPLKFDVPADSFDSQRFDLSRTTDLAIEAKPELKKDETNHQPFLNIEISPESILNPDSTPPPSEVSLGDLNESLPSNKNNLTAVTEENMNASHIDSFEFASLVAESNEPDSISSQLKTVKEEKKGILSFSIHEYKDEKKDKAQISAGVLSGSLDFSSGSKNQPQKEDKEREAKENPLKKTGSTNS